MAGAGASPAMGRAGGDMPSRSAFTEISRPLEIYFAIIAMEGPDSREVRDFFIGNALMWPGDYNADGPHLDAVDNIVFHSNRHFRWN